jgi:peptidoglycan/LPS O-acetylase OafA/YrhL
LIGQTGRAGMVTPGVMIENIPRLDTFRAVAALLVIEEHYFGGFLPWPFRNVAFAYGGVVFFFTLSGFLITTLLLRDQGGASSKLRRFYLRRSFRIFPIYYATLLFGLAVSMPGYEPAKIAATFYMINFCDLICPGGINATEYAVHFWTLAVEEQFYIVWPLLIVCIPRAAVAVSVAATLYGLALAVAPDGSLGVPRDLVVWMPISYAPALCGGALLAMAYHRGRLRAVYKVLTYLLPVSVALLPFMSDELMAHLLGPFGDYTVRQLFLVPIGCLLITRAVLDGAGSSSWGGRILPAVGKISYGIYVFHLPVRWYVDRYDPSWTLIWPRVVGVAVTVLLAWASWRWFETPLRNFGRRLAAPPQRLTASELAPVSLDTILFNETEKE